MKIILSHRDDGEPQFTEEQVVESTPDENIHLFFYLYNLGVYRTRQYEIVFIDDENPFSLLGMVEEVEAYNR